MLVIRIENPLALAAGSLGNIISVMVFLAPIPTFRKICKTKSTESHHSVPYGVALFSAMMGLFYGLATHDMYLMTINSFGCLIEIIYLVIFLIYAPKRAKICTLLMLSLFNVVLLGSFLVLTMLLAEGKRRITILGWAASSFALCVFIAPLSVIRVVIKTKSAEYMPFLLSFFLTLKAIAWSSYGLLKKDLYIGVSQNHIYGNPHEVPSILGLLFGLVQMALYGIYGKGKRVEEPQPKATEAEGSNLISITVGPEMELVAENESSCTCSAAQNGEGGGA